MSTAPVHVWEPPGKQISVHLSLPFIDRLGAAVRAGLGEGAGRGAEIGGLLLGRVATDGPRATIIEDFEPLPAEHLRGPSYTLSAKDKTVLAKRMWQAGRKRAAVVGYFRAHTRTGLYLDQDDFAVISAYFAQSDNVFLLVKPGETGLEGGLFFWENGDIRRQECYQTFPFESARLSVEKTARWVVVPPMAQPAKAPALQVKIVVSGLPPIPWRKAWLPLGVLAMGAVIVAALLTTHQARSDGERNPGNTLSAAVPIISPVPEPAMIELPARAEEVPAEAPPTEPARPRRPRLQLDESADVERAVKPSPFRESAERMMIEPPVQTPATVRLEPPPILRVPPPKSALGVSPVFDGLHRQAVVTVEPAQPRGVERIVSRIPLLRRLGRHRPNREEGFKEARPLRQVRPTVPESLLAGARNGAEVDLKVHIDKSGNVSEAELLNRGAEPTISDLAADAALGWRFAPAELNGKPVPSELVLRFRFNP